MRTTKDAGEAALLRKAVDASVAAHVAAMKAVKPNVHEYEIAALMDSIATMFGGTRYKTYRLYHGPADPAAATRDEEATARRSG